MISYILLGIPIGVLLLAIVWALFKKKKRQLAKPYYDAQEKKLYFPLEGDDMNIYDFNEPKIKNNDNRR